jgi:hypothetical protein
MHVFKEAIKVGMVLETIEAKCEAMLPVWFFITLIVVIAYLLYVTRTTEDNIIVMSKNQVKRLQYWMKESGRIPRF